MFNVGRDEKGCKMDVDGRRPVRKKAGWPVRKRQVDIDQQKKAGRKRQVDVDH